MRIPEKPPCKCSTSATPIADKARWDGLPGDLMFIPDAPHALEAVEDSVVVLTVAKRPVPGPQTDKPLHCDGKAT